MDFPGFFYEEAGVEEFGEEEFCGLVEGPEASSRYGSWGFGGSDEGIAAEVMDGLGDFPFGEVEEGGEFILG